MNLSIFIENIIISIFPLSLLAREQLLSRRGSIPRGEKTAATGLDLSFGSMGNPLILRIDSIGCGTGLAPEGESGFPAPRARYRSAGFRDVRQMRGIAGETRPGREGSATNAGEIDRPERGLLKNPSSLGIDHCRHAGESRNPFSSRMTIRRLFISPSLAGTNQKWQNKWIPSNPPALVDSDTGMTIKTAFAL